MGHDSDRGASRLDGAFEDGQGGAKNGEEGAVIEGKGKGSRLSGMRSSSSERASAPNRGAVESSNNQEGGVNTIEEERGNPREGTGEGAAGMGHSYQVMAFVSRHLQGEVAGFEGGKVVRVQ